MSINSAFQAMSKTYKANATTSSQTITLTPDAPCTKLCVASHEPSGGTGKPVFFVVSSNSSVTITQPGNGTPQYCLVSTPCTIKTFQIPGQASPTAPVYIAFLTDSGTAACYFTLGEGL
jgi:hypothetical protein